MSAFAFQGTNARVLLQPVVSVSSDSGGEQQSVASQCKLVGIDEDRPGDKSPLPRPSSGVVAGGVATGTCRQVSVR